jgi:hypothetical protein
MVISCEDLLFNLLIVTVYTFNQIKSFKSHKNGRGRSIVFLKVTTFFYKVIKGIKIFFLNKPIRSLYGFQVFKDQNNL